MTSLTRAYVVELRGQLPPVSAGAKAANLARIIEMGLTTPSAAAITRDALRLFLEESGLLADVRRLICDRQRTSGGSEDEAYRSLCERVISAPIPSRVREAADPAIRRLLEVSDNGLAVRSSGAHVVNVLPEEVARLAEGMTIEVDGTRGVVTLLGGKSHWSPAAGLLPPHYPRSAQGPA